MLYFFPDSWVTSGHGTKANEVISATDKTFIASRDAYPRTAEEAGAATVTLKVNAAKGVKAKIGAPGEEDLYQFTVTKPGRHVVETKGPTDLVAKLFGPDSATSLIAEDDDGGT